MTPLIRTEGKQYQSGYQLDVPRLLAQEPLRVESRDKIARDTEAALSLPPSLYFYVGHACPAFGDIVLVYEFEKVQPKAGTASDHDTGGLHAGYIAFDPPMNAAERKTWSGEPEHRWPIHEVPSRFTKFLSQYFADFAAYCTGQRATTDDDGGRLLHPDNERRAWSVEVRLEDDHPLLDGIRLIGLSTSAVEAIRDATTLEPGQYPEWERLLDDTVVRAFDLDMHAAIERLIASGALT